ncbi:alpha/beta hydrolase [Mucisphaera sp.]|uniref:alpha/beta hydrolase n=1 Tax=Mucisphaera sp. TaxID=2913024 RepID=UPI003D0FF367
MVGLGILLVVGLLVLWGATSGFLYWRLRHPPRVRRAWAVGRGHPAEPADLGLAGEEVVFRYERGTETPGWVIRGDCPERPVVVMSHGFGDGRLRMLQLATFVARHASAVVVYDVSAHGDSTDRKLTFAMREPFDLVEIVDQLPEGLRDRGVVLYGCSMGAVISVRAAVLPAMKDRVRGVILDGSYRLWWEPIDGIVRHIGCPEKPIVGLVRWLQPWIWPVVDDIDTARDVGKLDLPVLVLHGDEDPVCPVASARAIAAAAADSELVVFEGGTHLDLAGVDGARYDAAVERFMTAFEETAVVAGLAD